MQRLSSRIKDAHRFSRWSHLKMGGGRDLCGLPIGAYRAGRAPPPSGVPSFLRSCILQISVLTNDDLQIRPHRCTATLSPPLRSSSPRRPILAFVTLSPPPLPFPVLSVPLLFPPLPPHPRSGDLSPEFDYCVWVCVLCECGLIVCLQ